MGEHDVGVPARGGQLHGGSVVISSGHQSMYGTSHSKSMDGAPPSDTNIRSTPDGVAIANWCPRGSTATWGLT